MTIQKTFLLPVFVAILCGCQSAALDLPVDAEIRADQDLVVDPQEIVLVTPSPAAARSLIRKAVPLGYRVSAEDTLGGLDLIMLTLRIPPGQDGGSAIRELERLEPSVTAGVNHAYAPQATQTDRRTYAPQLMGWDPGGCEALTAIGVLDTAISSELPASVHRADFSRNRSLHEPAGHGTAIVELLHMPGLLENVDVFHADIVSPSGTLGEVASVDSMLRGLNWLIVSDVHLINISLSGPYNKILDRAFQSAERNGVIVVAASGNDGPDRSVRYPAGFSSTLAVTAIDADADIYDNAVRGEEIDFSAPGVDVYVDLASDGRFLTGTSIAAPFVTMRIAGDAETASLGSVDEVRAILSKSSSDLGAAGHDTTFGHGLISAPPACRNDGAHTLNSAFIDR
ncbi:MAG: S8 family serine peptidase [Pseudomonadota bacterium]